MVKTGYAGVGRPFAEGHRVPLIVFTFRHLKSRLFGIAKNNYFLLLQDICFSSIFIFIQQRISN